jgi:hypothetical protein
MGDSVRHFITYRSSFMVDCQSFSRSSFAFMFESISGFGARRSLQSPSSSANLIMRVAGARLVQLRRLHHVGVPLSSHVRSATLVLQFGSWPNTLGPPFGLSGGSGAGRKPGIVGSVDLVSQVDYYHPEFMIMSTCRACRMPDSLRRTNARPKSDDS